ncbi:MAG TPA: FAD-dependent oxidoreductase [Bacillota bacterium]|nr:FAD-dependent oxidoreductase [Bacillota bacterium]
MGKNDLGEIVIDCQCRTNWDGLFAAGDVTNVPEKQIVVASGEGAKAAIRAWESLIQQRTHAAQK